MVFANETFISTNAHELSVKKGSNLICLSHQDIIPGWTMVQQGDKTGLVPSRIVAQSSNNQNQFILTGFFYWLFYVVEPISVFAGAGAAWFDTQNFYHSLIPMPILWGSINPLEKMVVLQLGGCYFLLGMLGIFIYTAVKKALPYDLLAQEKIMKAFLFVLAFCDLVHVGITLLSLPSRILYSPSTWNAATHGNITFTLFLFVSRVFWFLSDKGSSSHNRTSRSKMQ